MGAENSGWVKIHRKIQDNELWLCESFSRGQAWIDLIFLANHKDGGFLVRGNWVEVKRGQVGYSKEALAARWKWSRGKVIKFLMFLEKRGQIEQQKSFIISLINIKNYNQYQGTETADDTTERQQKDSRPNTNKNDKNDKNIIISEEASPKSLKVTDLYAQMGMGSGKVSKVQLWQDEAANAVKFFNDGDDKRSSVFKCYRDNQQKARIAFSDCKELGRKSVFYFLKVFNELNKPVSNPGKN